MIAERLPDIDIRPESLDDFTGQPELKNGLRILLNAAKARREMPDHTLFYGPPGLGKTTLARIVAAEMGAKIATVAGPSIDTPGDLAAILTKLDGGILFIDEVHRMPMAIEETLYSAMEDFRLDLTMGSGEEARIISLPLARFTLVGATTRLGDLSNPLRDRFGASFRLDYYDDEQLAAIAIRTARVLGMGMTPEAALAIAKRSRGTPRVANRLVRRARDYAQVNGLRVISEGTAWETARIMGVDELGLDEMDRRLLRTLANVYNGGPVGVKTLGTMISEPESTVTDAIEPHLLRIELLKRTERGRMLTPAGWDYVTKMKEEVRA